jgi:hypothetical protein
MDFLWNTTLSDSLGSGKNIMTNMKHAVLIGVCSLFLIFMAVKFLVTGFNGITG